MASVPKKRKITSHGSISSTDASPTLIDKMDSKIRQAKKFAVIQAQKEGCLGNFRSFDSPFGNFLVPIIPTRADLFGHPNVHSEGGKCGSPGMGGVGPITNTAFS